MNTKEYAKWRSERTREREEMCDRKAKEYSGDQDRLASFREVAEDLGVGSDIVIMIFMRKHLDSINAYVRGRNPSGMVEPIKGRIYDMINYLEFLLAVVEEEQS